MTYRKLGGNMIYIAICDDNKNTIKMLKNMVISYLKENQLSAEIETYTQSQMLFYDLQENRHFDLILSDIEMPDMNGMELAALTKRYLPEVLIIFITSHIKYAVDAFELSIFRYVPKNCLSEKLAFALQDAINMINLQKNDFYVIKTANRIEKIPYKNILYIQREGKNSVIIMNNNSVTKVRKSLAQLFNEIGQEDFVFIERGTIVNLAYILTIKNNMVKLTNGVCLHPSQAKLEEVKNKLSAFWSVQL